ncbi:uncharacterized protein LOC143289411 [Babylonia areolata]|uniref:uncharacterized protein LOC143289411 n=1 Tax=Babylonia areolata TaxID=304850 RepID=UPI003FCFA749
MSTLVTYLFLLACCFSVSWQKCFDNHCAHHSPLSGCVGGQYLCQADEFCETITHVSHNSHSNSPWVHTACRPMAVLQDCVALQQGNDPSCDPNKHDIVCHWCCHGEQCMLDLAQGIQPDHTPLPSTTTLPTTTTTTQPTTTTTPAPTATTTTSGGAETVTIPTDVVPTTTATGAVEVCEDHCQGDCCLRYADRCDDPIIHGVCRKTCGFCAELECQDKYLGNCSADFAGRCSEYTVQLLCQKTCQTCDVERTTPKPCDDEYLGDCAIDFAGLCHDPAVHQVCQKTCGTCYESGCQDLYLGDCEKDLAGGCDSPFVQTVCQKTCNLCDIHSAPIVG